LSTVVFHPLATPRYLTIVGADARGTSAGMARRKSPATPKAVPACDCLVTIKPKERATRARAAGQRFVQ
jgi:hypothetical protein